MLYTVATGMLALLLGLFSRRRVTGHHHIPRQGGCVVACNHTAAIDPIYLGLAARPRQVRFMAKQELFKVPVLGYLLRRIGTYPVNRKNPGPSTMKETMRLLQRGEVVGIFPQGTRTEATQLKTGAVRLALKAGVPVMPAGYHGPVKLGLRDLFRRPVASIAFGPPISYAGVGPRPDDATLQRLVEELSQAITDLRQQAQEQCSESGYRQAL